MPAGYANANVQRGGGHYGNGFGFQDAANTNTATFFNTALTIKDVSSQMGASSFVMSFTADTAGFFDHAVISYDTFGGSLSLIGNTLTYSAPATGLAGTRMVTIMFQGISAGAGGGHLGADADRLRCDRGGDAPPTPLGDALRSASPSPDPLPPPPG